MDKDAQLGIARDLFVAVTSAMENYGYNQEHREELIKLWESLVAAVEKAAGPEPKPHGPIVG